MFFLIVVGCFDLTDKIVKIHLYNRGFKLKLLDLDYSRDIEC